MSATRFVIYKTKDKRWCFECIKDGKPVKHFHTAKRKAIHGVLRLNPGNDTIIISFRPVEAILAATKEK